MNKVFFGDCRDTMRALIAQGVKVQMCVTSPPYFGLRSYMPDGVRLKHGLPDAVREAVIAELASLGVHPTSD
jgi:DNA modification methylase